mgnify:CR=1 FL=1
MEHEKENLNSHKQMDAIDKYFECVTACSLGDQGVECVIECIQVHLK